MIQGDSSSECCCVVPIMLWRCTEGATAAECTAAGDFAIRIPPARITTTKQHCSSTATAALGTLCAFGKFVYLNLVLSMVLLATLYALG
jgi:hypothetical protein